MKEKNFEPPVSPLGLLDQVRNSCRQVAEKASFVRIRPARIQEYAGLLPLETIQTPELHPERHYLGRGEGTLAFFLVLDSINFGSGYFPHLKKRPGMSGYFTVASSLNDHFQKRGPMDCRELSAIRPEDCLSIFGQDPENETVAELMGLFARALNDLGDYVEAKFDGVFSNLLDAAEHSCERLASILTCMPFFRDIQSYNGQDVYFLKRAQLTAADLAMAFDGKGFGEFRDSERLTIFADNLVPHVLRMDGILEYDPGLLRRIDSEELIPKDGEEEIEIRACALDAVERIKAALNDHGQKVSSMGLDYLLWNRGQHPYYKRTKPRHRTRTVFY